MKTSSELKALIESRAVDHKAISNDDDNLWEAEIIEREVMNAIFEFMAATGFTVEGLNLQALLDAEDDDSPGVPEEGVDATLFDLWSRITDTDHKEHLQTPPEIKELWDTFEQAFWLEASD